MVTPPRNESAPGRLNLSIADNTAPSPIQFVALLPYSQILDLIARIKMIWKCLIFGMQYLTTAGYRFFETVIIIDLYGSFVYAEHRPLSILAEVRINPTPNPASENTEVDHHRYCIAAPLVSWQLDSSKSARH
jgi:hypothetical protein